LSPRFVPSPPFGCERRNPSRNTRCTNWDIDGQHGRTSAGEKRSQKDETDEAEKWEGLRLEMLHSSVHSELVNVCVCMTSVRKESNCSLRLKPLSVSRYSHLAIH